MTPDTKSFGAAAEAQLVIPVHAAQAGRTAAGRTAPQFECAICGDDGRRPDYRLGCASTASGDRRPAPGAESTRRIHGESENATTLEMGARLDRARGTGGDRMRE